MELYLTGSPRYHIILQIHSGTITFIFDNFDNSKYFDVTLIFYVFVILLSQHDIHRKPQGLIILDDSCRISKADGANTFEISISSGSEVSGKGKSHKTKSYYLTADTQPLMEDWVRVLQNVIQRNALQLLLRNRGNLHNGSTNSAEDGSSIYTLEGWLTKVKHGHSKNVW